MATTTGPVETKVKTATAGSYLGGLTLLAILNGVNDIELVKSWPDWAEIIFGPIVPSLVTFIAGWLAKHTPRRDLNAVDPTRGPIG